MSASLATSRAEIACDARGHIDCDLPCFGCGYNLRGLLPNNVCPECAAAIARSFEGNYLRFCRPEWVETLASGMNWIKSSILLEIALGPIGYGVGMAVGITLDPGLVLALSMLAGALTLLGCWKLTIPEPSTTESASEMNLLKVIRFSAVFGFLAATVGPMQRIPWLTHLLTVFASLSGLTMVTCGFAYTRRLALRIPDVRLAARTKLVMIGVAVVMGVSLIFDVALAIMPTAAPVFRPAFSLPSVPGATPCLVIGPLVLAYLVFGYLSLLLIDRYREAFREAAAQARDTWSRPPQQSTG